MEVVSIDREADLTIRKTGLFGYSWRRKRQRVGPRHEVGDRSVPAYRQRVTDRLVEPTNGRRRSEPVPLGLFAPSGSKLMKSALAHAPASPTEAISPSKITLKCLLGGKIVAPPPATRFLVSL